MLNFSIFLNYIRQIMLKVDKARVFLEGNSFSNSLDDQSLGINSAVAFKDYFNVFFCGFYIHNGTQQLN